MAEASIMRDNLYNIYAHHIQNISNSIKSEKAKNYRGNLIWWHKINAGFYKRHRGVYKLRILVFSL